MGTGPATHLSTEYNAYSLLLMSPYTSIKDVSRSLFGRFSFMITPLVYERFRNIDSIQHSRCPVFFLHGMKDKLIPHSHSIELNNVCSSVSFLHMPKEMDHNVFDFDEDLIKPFKEFLKKIDDSIASEARRAAKGQAAVEKKLKTLIKIDDSHVSYRDGPNSLKAARNNNADENGSNEAESSEEEEDN
jgi:acetyl esterase/lipase